MGVAGRDASHRAVQDLYRPQLAGRRAVAELAVAVRTPPPDRPVRAKDHREAAARGDSGDGRDTNARHLHRGSRVRGRAVTELAEAIVTPGPHRPEDASPAG